MREVGVKIMLRDGHSIVFIARDEIAQKLLSDYYRTNDAHSSDHYSSKDYPCSSQHFDWVVCIGDVVAIHTAILPSPQTGIQRNLSGYAN